MSSLCEALAKQSTPINRDSEENAELEHHSSIEMNTADQIVSFTYQVLHLFYDFLLHKFTCQQIYLLVMLFTVFLELFY